MGKIAVNGYINIDHIIQIPKFIEDQEFEINKKEIISGGSAANVAFGLSLLDLETYFLGAIGNDEYGDYLLKNLGNVKLDYIEKIKTIESGTTYSLINPEGLRTMYTYPGANNEYNPNIVQKGFLNSLSILHLSSPNLDIAFELLNQIEDLNSVQISLDPSSLLTSKGYDYLEKLLKYIDILFLNEDEQNQLFPDTKFDESIQILHNLNIKYIFVKQGEKGAFMSKKIDGKIHSHHANAKEVDAIDSTGAGDAFAVGSLYGIVNNYSDQKILNKGIEISASAVQYTGARKGYTKYIEN